MSANNGSLLEIWEVVVWLVSVCGFVVGKLVWVVCAFVILREEKVPQLDYFLLDRWVV